MYIKLKNAYMTLSKKFKKIKILNIQLSYMLAVISFCK